ncbi:MAG: hypothetical protein OD815_001155 [Candidatus Alkanophagales archaeon MCA70_species_2]|nr:hypothetical protein [Candidatus Alkanophaga liquidiphilum]
MCPLDMLEGKPYRRPTRNVDIIPGWEYMRNADMNELSGIAGDGFIIFKHRKTVGDKIW